MTEKAGSQIPTLSPLRSFFTPSDRRFLLPLTLFFLVVRICLVLLIPMNILPDSYNHIAYSLMVRQGDFNFTLPWGWLALYYFFLAPFLWNSDPVTSARIISAILWTIATVLVYLITRQMTFSPRISGFAALLYSLTPYNLILSITAMAEALLAVAFFSAIFLFLRFRVSITLWNALGLAVSLGVACFTRVEGIVLVGLLAMLLLIGMFTKQNVQNRRQYLLFLVILVLIVLGVFLQKILFLSPSHGDPGGYTTRLLDPNRILYHIITYGLYLANLPSMLTPLIFFLGLIGGLLALMRSLKPHMLDVAVITFGYLLLYPIVLLPYIGEFVLFVFPRYNVFPLALLCIFGASWLVPAIDSAVRLGQSNHASAVRLFRVAIPRSFLMMGTSLLVFTAAAGITAHTAYLEMKIHERVTQPYYLTGLWLGDHCNTTNHILLENFMSDGIVLHSRLSATQFSPMASLPDGKNEALAYLQSNNITFLVWSLRDPICTNHPLLAPLRTGEDQTHFILHLHLEDFIHDLHELVMVYEFIP